MSEQALPSSLKKKEVELKQLKCAHHVAYRCRDAEQTRWFYEDVLGLPLVLALDLEDEPGTGQRHPYLHLFFQMADGNMIAFFDAPDSMNEKQFEPKHSFDLHLAFEVDTIEELKAWRKRINLAGRPCFGPINHEFVDSIYMYDPNGYMMEITVRTPVYDKYIEEHGGKAHDILNNWVARTRAQKIEICGEEAVNTRGVYFPPAKQSA